MPAECEQRVRNGRALGPVVTVAGEQPAADAVLRGTPSTGAGKEWGVFPLAAKFGIERDHRIDEISLTLCLRADRLGLLDRRKPKRKVADIHPSALEMDEKQQMPCLIPGRKATRIVGSR